MGGRVKPSAPDCGELSRLVLSSRVHETLRGNCLLSEACLLSSNERSAAALKLEDTTPDGSSLLFCEATRNASTVVPLDSHLCAYPSRQSAMQTVACADAPMQFKQALRVLYVTTVQLATSHAGNENAQFTLLIQVTSV